MCWQATVDQIKTMMYHPDVEPKWYQMPIRIFNAASGIDHWMDCWNPEKKDLWVHPQVEISVKENIYGTDRFSKLFGAISAVEFPNTPTASISGMTAEESPTRHVTLTYIQKYKWVTWGRIHDKKRGHYAFYPLYDWSYMDVWKAIHANKWPYCAIYDLQYQYGVPILNMRVSNVHHETALRNLFYMQEVEPDTYERVVRRIQGIDAAAKLGKKDYWITEHPFMFTSWREYRDYLLEKLIDIKDWKEKMKKRFEYIDKTWGERLKDGDYRIQIQSILAHDWEGTKLKRFVIGADAIEAREEYYKRRDSQHDT